MIVLTPCGECNEQPDPAAINRPAPPGGGERAGAGTALAVVAHERSERGSDEDGDEVLFHKEDGFDG